jgi:G2/mitotic-specific cyclin 1/2
MQTRRLARRNDENAPPAASTIATRSRTAGATTNGGSTAIPVIKRGTSASTTTSTTETKPTSLATKRRAALGEPAAAPAGKDVKDGKDGKKVSAAERRPLASTTTAQGQQALRRATRAAAAEDKTTIAATKRKAAVSTSTTTRRPGVTRGNSAVSTASGSTVASNTTARPSRALKETASLTDVGPNPKRRRPSPEIEEDVFSTRYDADAKELSVPKSVKTETLVKIQRRPKDFGWTDLDAEDEGDPSMVSEYVVDAFNYMLEKEVSIYNVTILC